MSQLYRVIINLYLLKAHLEREDGESHDEAAIKKMLIDAGFMQQGDRWIVLESELGLLQPSEVDDIELIAAGPRRSTGGPD